MYVCVCVYIYMHSIICAYIFIYIYIDTMMIPNAYDTAALGGSQYCMSHAVISSDVGFSNRESASCRSFLSRLVFL